MKTYQIRIRAEVVILSAMVLILAGIADTTYAAMPGPKIVIISVDSLDPELLNLNSNGERGGRPGDWLVPNIRAFVDDSVLFADTRDWLPSATDMNHLNALAGTSSAQTGIIGVSRQIYGWKTDGTPDYKNTSLSYAKDGMGREVDTIFKAFKRKHPGAKILFASGKEWVAKMFDVPGSGIDILITGKEPPAFFPVPWEWNFFDPPSDRNPKSYCDRESIYQYGYCRLIYESNPANYPCDNWMVSAVLNAIGHESPDVSFILLAQLDDLQHGLGSPRSPEEYYDLACAKVHKRNRDVYREPVIDGIKDVDAQFGILIDSLKHMPDYRDAIFVLYSDHGHATYTSTVVSNVNPFMHTNIPLILYRSGVITKKEKDEEGFAVSSIASLGQAYFRAGSYQERYQRAKKAKAVLDTYKIYNNITKQWESPWYILGVDEMISGLPGVCEPGEMFHEYFAYNNAPSEMLWPDLMILMRSGWQLPVTSGAAANIGTQLPEWLPPMYFFLGGHGSVSTVPIVMAFGGPGFSHGKVISDPSLAGEYRISDIAVTISRLYGLDLQSSVIGRDRSGEF